MLYQTSEKSYIDTCRCGKNVNFFFMGNTTLQVNPVNSVCCVLIYRSPQTLVFLLTASREMVNGYDGLHFIIHYSIYPWKILMFTLVAKIEKIVGSNSYFSITHGSVKQAKCPSNFYCISSILANELHKNCLSSSRECG